MFLCFIREHSLRVSTSPEMQDDLPVPGGPATMIPGEEKQKKTHRSKMSALDVRSYDTKSLEMFAAL